MRNNTGKYRDLRPGDYGTCVLNYSVHKKPAYDMPFDRYDETGIVTSHETRLLVVAVVSEWEYTVVRVVLPDGTDGWLRLRNRPLFADSPGKLTGRDLHVVSPKLKVHPNRTVSWRTFGESQTDT